MGRRPDEREETAAGPIFNPVDRFEHLPEPTRVWLEDLREADIQEFNEAVRFYRSVRSLGWFAKWSIISLIGFFITASQLGEAIQKLWALIGLSRGP